MCRGRKDERRNHRNTNGPVGSHAQPNGQAWVIEETLSRAADPRPRRRISVRASDNRVRKLRVRPPSATLRSRDGMGKGVGRSGGSLNAQPETDLEKRLVSKTLAAMRWKQRNSNIQEI